MVFLLFISVLVKAYVMKYDYTNYITELTIIILSAIYVAIRSIMTGNNLMDTSKRSKTLCVLGAFGASIIITAINGVENYTNYGEHYSGLLDLAFPCCVSNYFYIFIRSYLGCIAVCLSVS